MNNWKNELKQAFDAPSPLRKREFMRQLDCPRMRIREFLFTQIGYIRKWVWCVSAFTFIASVLSAAFLSDDILWIISALTPLLALTIISESGRSECYEMAELEMATRFSLKSVVLARLGILGVTNLMLLCLLVPIGLWNNVFSPVASGLYIITPYLLTTFFGLFIVRKFKGREAIYACAGVTVCISFSVLFSHSAVSHIYQENYLVWWAAGALALCIGTGKQYITIINRTEELAWNL